MNKNPNLEINRRIKPKTNLDNQDIHHNSPYNHPRKLLSEPEIQMHNKNSVLKPSEYTKHQLKHQEDKIYFKL